MFPYEDHFIAIILLKYLQRLHEYIIFFSPYNLLSLTYNIDPYERTQASNNLLLLVIFVVQLYY